MKKNEDLIQIYLIRHGEAEKSWDEDSDPGLSDLGKQQSKEILEMPLPKINTENNTFSPMIPTTGGTAEAGAKIIEMGHGKVELFIFVINLFDLGGCDKLVKKGYKVENLIEFPGH